MRKVFLEHKGVEGVCLGEVGDATEAITLAESNGWRVVGAATMNERGDFVLHVAEAHDFAAANFAVSSIYPNVVCNAETGREIARCGWFPNHATDADRATAALFAGSPRLFRLLDAVVSNLRQDGAGEFVLCAEAADLVKDAGMLLAELRKPR